MTEGAIFFLFPLMFLGGVLDSEENVVKFLGGPRTCSQDDRGLCGKGSSLRSDHALGGRFP
jgi:hypothetical protein